MLSGAETELNGAALGGEEQLGGDAGEGSQRTDGAEQDGEQVPKWVDIDINSYPEPLRPKAEELNKAAKSQFQNKVREIVESNKPYKQKVTELQGVAEKYNAAVERLKGWVVNPDSFFEWHKQAVPNHPRYKGAPAEGVTEADKKALEVLRKAGIVTREDLQPLIDYVGKSQKVEEEKLMQESKTEIAETEKWCKENKYPWSEEVALGCIGLIRAGKADNLKAAYEILYKPMIETTQQLNLTHKKKGSTLQPTGKIDSKTTNLSLRQQIESAADDLGM